MEDMCVGSLVVSISTELSPDTKRRGIKGYTFYFSIVGSIGTGSQH